MKKAIAVSLLISILITAFTGVAFAMTEEEILAAVEANEGKYEAGSPLTKDDFLVYSTYDTLAKYEYDILDSMSSYQSWGFWGCTSKGFELLGDNENYSLSYTYRGISIENRNADSSICSKDIVMQKYGIGLSGTFDPKTDVQYREYSRKKADKIYAEMIAESKTWLIYNYKDIAQIKFYFDSDDLICYCVFFNGIQDYADKETTQTIQEYLNENGYDCGTPDGIAGKKTKAALTQFQQDHDLFPSGYIDDCLMKYLDKQNVNI